MSRQNARVKEPAIDLAVVGGGAAGLMAAIEAGRQARRLGRPLRIVVFDGARVLGAKILVAGGGRCNVTHDRVDASAFAGSTPAAIRNVLRRFDVAATIRFFEELGVPLKREETGKLFPTSDRARTVLDALLRACRDAGVVLDHPWRVLSIERAGGAFVLSGTQGTMVARRIVLATGGRALPKSGSDGHGYELARRLGHGTTPRIFPGLVPIVVDDRAFVRELAGIAVPARVELRSASGKRLAAVEDPVLCCHFGLSGPAVLDISRHWIEARAGDPGAHLVVNWLPAIDLAASFAEADGRHGALALLRPRLPERLARALCREAGIEPGSPIARLPRDKRRALQEAVGAWRVPAIGDRGFTHAEVTAGGVPLAQLHLDTLESRVCPGLHLVGEILDVDGRIGGYNFQWAWSSGFLGGSAAASALVQAEPSRSGGSTPAASR